MDTVDDLLARLADGEASLIYVAFGDGDVTVNFIFGARNLWERVSAPTLLEALEEALADGE